MSGVFGCLVLSRGETALHEAARWGYSKLVEELLKAKADVEAESNTGRGPPNGAVVRCFGWRRHSGTGTICFSLRVFFLNWGRVPSCISFLKDPMSFNSFILNIKSQIT